MLAHFRLITSGRPRVRRTVVVDSLVKHLTVDFGHKFRLVPRFQKVRDPGFAESKVWNLGGSWTLVENCRNARGCFYIHFKAKQGVYAVSITDLPKFTL